MNIRNAVIVTAKGGNTSVSNKNVIPVLGVPVMLYPLRASRFAVMPHKTFVSTEDNLIAELAKREGAEIIDRPQELATPESQHKDVIEHAVRFVHTCYPTVENIVVLLGNTVQITPAVVDTAFTMLESGDCDSVATVWQAQDDHPFRAMVKNDDGFMRPYSITSKNSNRQTYPPVYFYDQGVWGFKTRCAFEQKGPPPWVWLGEKCKMIERPWVTGRDIHSWIDISASVWYLNSIQVNDYVGYSDK